MILLLSIFVGLGLGLLSQQQQVLARHSIPIAAQFDAKNVTFSALLGVYPAGVAASFDLANGAYAWLNQTAGETYIFAGCHLSSDGWTLHCGTQVTINATGCDCYDYKKTFDPLLAAAEVLWMAHKSQWNWTLDTGGGGGGGCWQALFDIGGYDDLAYVCLDGGGVPTLAAGDDADWLNTTLALTRVSKPGHSLVPLTVPTGCCQQ
jgi:hypothetical protein